MKTGKVHTKNLKKKKKKKKEQRERERERERELRGGIIRLNNQVVRAG